MAPHRRLLVDVTVTSARTNTNVHGTCARFPLPGSPVFGAQEGKLDADLRTSALLGTPSVKSVHDYYPIVVENGGMLAPVAVELVRMGVAYSHSLRFDNYVRMDCIISFVDLLMFPFSAFTLCSLIYFCSTSVPFYSSSSIYLCSHPLLEGADVR
jgi:hypothetical protein